MALDSYPFMTKTKLTVGAGALSKVASELARLGAKRAMIVTDAGLVEAGLAKKLQDALGEACAGLFDGVIADSGVGIVNAGVEKAKEIGADSIVSMGGGSSMDTAKAILILMKKGGELPQHMIPYGIKENLDPHIAIPTTAGTGSEVTHIAVIKNEQMNLKMNFLDGALIPDVAILDPELTTGLNARLTAATGVDALVHAIEAYVSTRSQPLSDMLALGAIRQVRQYLPTAVAKPNDLTARLRMLEAATAAGWAFSNALVGIVHAMAHVVGAQHGVHHGLANAILLVPCMRFNLDAVEDRYAEIGRAMDPTLTGASVAEAAQQGIDRIESFIAGLGIPTKLGAVGVPESALAQMAPLALADGSILSTPKPASGPETIEAIYRQAYA